MNVTTIGIDLAKHSFSLHGVDARGKTVFRKTLSRAKLLPFLAQQPPCLVGMEACSGAHHWGRQLVALGHRVGIMVTRFVAPYRKGWKNDGNDAEAICEAVERPRMRFVPVKRHLRALTPYNCQRPCRAQGHMVLDHPRRQHVELGFVCRDRLLAVTVAGTHNQAGKNPGQRGFLHYPSLVMRKLLDRSISYSIMLARRRPRLKPCFNPSDTPLHLCRSHEYQNPSPPQEKGLEPTDIPSAQIC